MATSSGFLSFKNLVTSFLLVLAAAMAVAVPRWMRLYQSPALVIDQTVDIYLDQEQNSSSFKRLMMSKALLKDEEEFTWALRTLRWNTFREGHYELSRDISYDEMFSKIGKGLQDPIRLTILPGQSRTRLANTLSNAFQFDSLALKHTLNDSTFLADLQVDSQQVVGRLYPATYEFYWTVSPQKVIRRLFTTFETNITSEYSSRIAQLERPVDEIITLASIIEWEAKNEAEKPVISGVYWNRLRKGMKLQADPTVNFAVGERRRLMYDDYKVEHPYNTYLHVGLPPGPINNPSKSSIEAALFPESHDYLYMVASPDGTHNFSKTYREHLRKSAEWRRWLEEQYRIKRSREKQEH